MQGLHFGFFAFIVFLISSSAFSAPPLMVILGGHASCNPSVPKIMPPTKGMWFKDHATCFLRDGKMELDTDAKLPTPIYGCFDNAKNAADGYLYYGAGGKVPEYVSTSDNSKMISALVDSVKAAAGKDQEILIVGHSHGGWAAMKMVLELGKRASAILLDPISRETCPPQKYLNVAKTFSTAKERQKLRDSCTGFPSDITKAERKTLFGKDERKVALNFYSQKGAEGKGIVPLHSGPMTGGDNETEDRVNQEVSRPKHNSLDPRGVASVRNPLPIVNPKGYVDHIKITTDERVWKKARRDVNAAYGVREGNSCPFDSSVSTEPHDMAVLERRPELVSH